MQIVYSCHASPIIYDEVQWIDRRIPLILWEIYLRNRFHGPGSLSKFRYLKELLEKQVRKDIEELSFTEEAYEDT